ncbi:hypothetical protein ACFWYW_58705 [Nonomuraea sp. NPDC059023]|uniref:hypothetical protein n=1 Tax=unclassified Nonomuraea TaxID=2593643 RepID=UPI0036CF0DB3
MGATEMLDDGRRQVIVALLDKYDDPREESPAARSLIDALEAASWVVMHERGRFASRLQVTEPGEEA